MFMTNSVNRRSQVHHMIKLGRIAAALATAFTAAGSANAFEIDTGNEDLVVRWDNTVRYTYGKRTDDQDPALLKNPNANDGNYNFKRWATASNRLDILSEFDVVYKKRSGVRVSAAGWYDYAYQDIDGNRNNPFPNNFATASGIPGTANPPAYQFSDYTSRYYKGPSGEWLDAFVFTGFDAGDVPINIKAGQHTVYWGEGLLIGGLIHGVSYSQSPADLAKAQVNPGIEAKELYRPLGSISATAQATSELSFAAQYFYDWQGTRIPEAGTYLGNSDAALFGAATLYSPFGVLNKLNPVNPKNSGDWGVNARWSPEWADATIGFYYRNFSDKLPGNYLDLRGNRALPGSNGLASQNGYGFAYGSDIDLFGLSFSKQIAGISWGAELNYRKNMPLVSDPLIVVTPQTLRAAQVVPQLAALRGATTTLPGEGDSATARGNTMHGILNAIGTGGKSPLWDAYSWNAELAWSTWTSVTENANLFKGRSGYTAIDKADKNAIYLGVNFVPTWYQVFPSVNLTMPLSYGRGLSGNSAVQVGGNEGAGSYAVGIGAEYASKYLFDLRYVDYFGRISTDATGAMTVANGANAALKDRGWLVFTFKTTF